jgi:phage terminase large subunit-like protein
LGDPNDLHNGNELLCAIRLLRLLDTYELNRDKIDDVIYMGEGEWRQDNDGYWQYIQDGLGQPGRQGLEVYRWEPFQVFMVVAMYGPMAWIGTESYEGERRLTETERINEDTREIEDLRRLCTRFVLFGPRKINKSGFAAITNVEDFMFGDYDSQVVCTANSQEQSKILFNKTKDLLIQLDPVTGRKFNGKYLSYTATEVKFMKGKYRAAELIAIPAGGKMPDGKFASRSAEDEYGSAGYTNGRSDMGQTAAVIESSMGPRREPMTVITTTASLITAGPFMEMLDALHRLLLMELKYATGEATPNKAEDRQMCLLLEPDGWERDEEYLLTSKTVRRKINPMLGKIVQHSFYDDECAKSRMDETKKKETISKLFNVYQSNAVQEWIKPEVIRNLQVDMTIDDCTADKGWVVFCALDLSQGDDWNTAGYLAARRHKSGRGYDLFADFSAWIKQDVLEKSSIRPLYEEWIAKGFLHVSPGAIFQSSLFIQRLDELFKKGIQIQAFGYDSYQSKDPINSLKAYLSEMGVADPDKYCIPISQRNAEFNAPTDDLALAIKSPIPYISFSNNPAWSWLFGNCVLSIDGKGGTSANMDLGNKKPVKRNPGSDSCKVDPIQCLVMGMDLLTRFEGQKH